MMKKIDPWNLNIAVLLLICVICLLALCLPSRLTLNLPAGGYTLQIISPMAKYAVSMSPMEGMQQLTLSGFNVSALLQYPNYSIGIAVVLAIAILGMAANIFLAHRLKKGG